MCSWRSVLPTPRTNLRPENTVTLNSYTSLKHIPQCKIMNCHLLLQLTCLHYSNRLSFPCSSPRHFVDTELFTQYEVMINLLSYIVVKHPV